MAFLKFINETITYPYNTKTDYPYTGFPPGTDYPEFNIFWVHPTSPNPPENNLLTEETPLFNDELNQRDPMYPAFLNPPKNNLLTEKAPVFNDELNQGDPMYPTPPNPPEDNSWTEGTPVFNTELNRWEQTWNYTPIAPEPDWAGLRADLLDSATISAWFDTLSAINREDITAQIQGRNLSVLEDGLMRVNYTPVKDELNTYLSNRHVPLQLQ